MSSRWSVTWTTCSMSRTGSSGDTSVGSSRRTSSTAGSDSGVALATSAGSVSSNSATKCS